MAPLHHRPEISNMRCAYEHDKQSRRDDSPNSIHDSAYGSGSTESLGRPPTSYPTTGPTSRLPPVVHQLDTSREDKVAQYEYITDGQRCATPTSIEEDARTQTTISVVDSEYDEDLDEIPGYDPPEYTDDPYYPTAIPSRPADFSQLFPSHRRLDIRHDDSTTDGNMNLRIDTKVKIENRKCDMTLFHLRMHDLRNREFSLRRYCRDSGREVCKSTRKHGKSTSGSRPSFQRSLSNALHSLRPKMERTSSDPSTLSRHDSGYGSMHSTDEKHNEWRPTSSGSDVPGQEQPLTNTIKLEFSNYAQVDVNLSKDKKRYEFDYWKYEFAWKKMVDKPSNEVSFHLVEKHHSKQVLAYIRPIPLTDDEAEEEHFNGGWIPQCMMWIADEGIVNASKDVADAVIAAGLMALVDDSIRTRFHSAESQLLMVPKSKLQAGVENVTGTRLINEMFGRKESKLDNDSVHSQSDKHSKPSRVTSRPSSRDH